MQWNFTMQKQIGENVITVSYVGMLGRHLQWAHTVNTPVPPGNATQPTFIRAATIPNVQAITLHTTGAGSAYNAAQFVFERRYSKGLTVNANYVFSRNLTHLVDNGEQNNTLSDNRQYDWGNAGIGFEHKLNFRLNYELPFGLNANGWKRQVIAGWQINTITFWQSGEPFTVFDGQNLINLPNTTQDRPNQIAGQSCTVDNPSISNWINLNAWQQQPLGFAGNEGARQCYGPHWKSVDLSIFKEFSVTERAKLSFRAEAYNLSNTPNFALPNSTISAWSVSRQPSGIPTRAAAFGQITATNIGFTPRVMQLALKLIF